MLGILYILISWSLGYIIIKLLLPQLFKIAETNSLWGRLIKLDHWMVTIPAAYLIGTLVLTWSTYISAYLFKDTNNPLFFGNLVTLGLSSILISIYVIRQRNSFTSIFTHKLGPALFKKHKTEIAFITIATILSSFLMFYTFNIRNGTLYVGVTVFSDFGPHLAMIRSFSFGSNFPTLYPHFPDGSVRYHFLFQFLTGNLEYLGFPLDWAFNLPSILSMVALFMLLYSLSVVLFGEKLIGILASALFFFRSSFAALTYFSDLDSKGLSFVEVFKNETFIGKTAHEDWGLYAQNVYANQRHLAFSLALLLLILILIIPLFKKMLLSIRASREKITGVTRGKKLKKSAADSPKAWTKKDLIKSFWREFLFSKDAWLPYQWKVSIVLGILLGLMGFWNGAVLIATITILFAFAVFSKQRLDYGIMAALALALFYGQVSFFIPTGNAVGENDLFFIGFLANIPPDLANQVSGFISSHQYGSILGLIPKLFTPISSFYIELLGILPMILLIGLLAFQRKLKWISVLLVIPALIYLMFVLTPSMVMGYKTIIFMALAASVVILLISQKVPLFPKGSRRIMLAFLMPIFLATTIKLTPDIAVNHKYIMISAMLLSIIAAWYFTLLLKTRGSTVLAIFLILIMTSSGVLDFITLINKNKQTLAYNMEDPVTLWAKEKTDPQDIFLTDTYVIHPLLLSGRKIFYGWPYFAWSAGYDTFSREQIVSQIYGGTDKKQLIQLVKENDIDYIVVENSNRESKPYTLNEALIQTTFKEVYNVNGITIYKTTNN